MAISIEKNELLINILFSAIKCRPSLKFLHTFLTIGNDCVSVYLLSHEMLFERLVKLLKNFVVVSCYVHSGAQFKTIFIRSFSVS